MITKAMESTVKKALAAPEEHINNFGRTWEKLTPEEQETVQAWCSKLTEIRNMGLGGAFEVVGAIGLKLAKMEKGEKGAA